MVAYAPNLLPTGAVNSACVRNLDLAPTFLDVARVPSPAQFEGKSILPVATGKAAPHNWEDDFIYEYCWEWTFPHTPTTFAIERGRMKYMQYHGVWDIEELYNLKNDPNEMNNLINDPARLQTKMDLRHRLYLALADRNGRHVVVHRALEQRRRVSRQRGLGSSTGDDYERLETISRRRLQRGFTLVNVDSEENRHEFRPRRRLRTAAPKGSLPG
jgi:arylsulfatase A-like enzyme